ncbi:MAG: restriction endonuclease subunit S [Micrococcales bacterium]|nr:restriction endonuclease subunit S [Micrococcales bacterium]
MSWKTVTIGEVCDLSTGGTPSKEKTEYFDNGEILWLVSGDIHKREIFDCSGRITELGYKNSNAKFLPIDSVLIALNGQGKTRGSVALLRVKATCNQSLVAITPRNKDELDSKYLFYYLDGKYEDIRRLTGDSGNDRRGLNMPMIRKIFLPLPPISTQQKIVAKLDAIFAEIDRATAAAETNAKNAEALFSQVLNNLDAEDSGVSKNLGDCVELLSGFAFKSSEYTDSDDDIPLLRGDNLNPMSIDFSKAKRFDKNRLSEYHKFSLSINDIVLGMDRPLISTGLRIAKVQAKDLPSLLVQRVMRLRCSKVVNPDFLFYLLNSDKFIKHLVGEQTGLGVPHISGKTISSFQVKIPSIEIQRNTVSKLHSIEERLNAYKLANRKILNNLKFYRQSILKRAFSGELVKE